MNENEISQSDQTEKEFALIPDDKTKTMILCPIVEGKTGIKLTKRTAQILIAMLDHQIQEW